MILGTHFMFHFSGQMLKKHKKGMFLNVITSNLLQC